MQNLALFSKTGRFRVIELLEIRLTQWVISFRVIRIIFEIR